MVAGLFSLGVASAASNAIGADGATPSGVSPLVSPPIVEWIVPRECPDAHSVEARARNLAGAEASTWAETGRVRGRIVSEGVEGGDWVLSLEIERASDAGAGHTEAAGAASPGIDAGGIDASGIDTSKRDAPGVDAPGVDPSGVDAPGVDPSGINAPGVGASWIDTPASTSGSDATGIPVVGVSPVAPARVFHGRDCTELAEAAAVAIALALGGFDSAPAPVEAPPPAAVPPPPPPPQPEHDAGGDTESSLAASLRSLGAVAHAEGVVDTASLGGVALGASAEVGVRWSALGLSAYGVGLPSRQIRLASEQYVELSLWAAGLRGCYRVGDGAPLLDVCAGGEVGAFGAAGRGLNDSRVRRDVWGATTWGAWLGVELLEHLEAGARLEAVLPMTRERYFVNRNDVVHEVPGASIRLALSLGGTLGSD